MALANESGRVDKYSMSEARQRPIVQQQWQPAQFMSKFKRNDPKTKDAKHTS